MRQGLTGTSAFAHSDLALELQNSRDRVGAAEGVGRAHGIAVHRGTVKVRHILRCRDVLRKDAAQGMLKRDKLLPFKGSELFFDQPENLFRRFYFQHDLHLRHDLSQIAVIIPGKVAQLLPEGIAAQDLQQLFPL